MKADYPPNDKRYVLDILAGLVPTDPHFLPIWTEVNKATRSGFLTIDHQPAADFVPLAEKIRKIRG